LSQAKTAPTQVAVSQSARVQAEAKVEQARASLKDAQLKLSYCRIYAPIDGRVSKKSVEVGELVQPGTPLMAIVENEGLWVIGNYKETQLSKVVPGQKAVIEVDALRGQRFTGRVDSIAAATGSTFALLPPENASGNFTKVVQRVPVKIVLDSGQPGLERLRGGMSVKTVITLSQAGTQ
jgi:membrane fusion protein (multidrug efflux system)